MTLPKPQNLRRVSSSSGRSLSSSPPSVKPLRRPSLRRGSTATLSASSFAGSTKGYGYVVVGALCLLLLVVYQAWVVWKLQQYGTGCNQDGAFVKVYDKSADPKPFSSSAKVGLCTITRNAIRYLDEWIDYHLFAMDFYEIYLFDNSDTFELKYYEHPFAKQDDKIYVTHFPGFGALHQRAAYELCTANYRNRVDYLAFWDDDEFLVLYQHESVGDFVKDHLINGSSLTLHWRIFGTSNHSHYRPLPLVTQRFVYRNVTDERVKSIVRPQDFKYMINPHAVKLRGQKAHRGHRFKKDDNNTKKYDKWSNMYYNQTGFHRWRDITGGGNYTWDGSRNRLIPPENDTAPIAFLHHYKYKSEEDWDWKMCDRWGFSRMPHKDCGTVPMVGHVFDDRAWQILKRRVPRYAALEPWS